MKSFKVALVQHRAVPNNLDANLALGLTYVLEAKALGADIVLFPEMWSNGYAPPFEDAFDDPFNTEYEQARIGWLNAAIGKESDYIKRFCELAKELNIGIVMSYLSVGDVAPRNCACVINREGHMIMSYSKVHTCDFSLEALLESGDDFCVCEFDGIKLGLMICYDREFPESARILMLKGAELILVPNACDINPARLNQLSTRAFENMTGIAMANYPGPGCGQSCAFSPIVFNEAGYVDNLIHVADDTLEDIIIVEFEMDAIRDYRQHETWGNAYRKVCAYTDLVRKEVEEPFIRKPLH
ncbi:MAG: carbon-nitrogen hydrolase family protein [Turicibacter sp.]